MAAALVLGFALGFGLKPPGAISSLHTEDVVTGTNEVTTLTLMDGTVVRLGENSRLGFGDASGPRDVFLQGQAYFAVPPDQPEPFRVHTGAGEVKVIGTRFDVQARGKDVQVMVVQGEVEMGSPGSRVNLIQNQIGRAVGGEQIVIEEVTDVYGALGWMGSFMAYESTALDEIAEEFESRFNLLIEIEQEQLRTRTVTGWFADQTPGEMLASICLAVDARCTFSGQSVRISLFDL